MPDAITGFIARNWVWLIPVYAVWSTAVNSLPEPTRSSKPAYQFVYRFAHCFALNLVTAFGRIGRVPWVGEVQGLLPGQMAQVPQEQGEAWPRPIPPAPAIPQSGGTAEQLLEKKD